MYLIASRCGARPKQIRTVTADHIHYDSQGRMFWVFDDHKDRRENPEAVGGLLLSLLGDDHKDSSVGYKKASVCEHRGKPVEQGHCWPGHASRAGAGQGQRKDHGLCVPTLVRDGCLLYGVSMAVVAELLGHVDTRMVGRVYVTLISTRGNFWTRRSECLRRARLAYRPAYCLISD